MKGTMRENDGDEYIDNSVVAIVVALMVMMKMLMGLGAMVLQLH